MRRFLGLIAILAGPTFSQVSSATLTGLVTDPSDARLPNVSLQLTSEDTGVALNASTNTAGEYTFSLLPPGRYRLTAEAQGFRRHSHAGLVLELGRATRLDLRLDLGQVAETVEVSGSPPLLESESATVGAFIENKTIIDMPLNGRRVGELLASMGHTVFITGDIIRPRVATGGGRGDQQQWMIDGVNSSNIALEVTQALFNPPVEAVQEVRVQQNNYSAEFGNSSSGVVTITTKSGTNSFHGDAYEFFRNDRLDARNFFAARKAPLRWNIFGVAAGGPVRRNKTFFFSHAEWQRQRVGVVRLLTVPSLRERAGDFSQTLTAAGRLLPIYDPATTRPDPSNPSARLRDAFPGNIIPAGRIDPVGAKIAALYALPNQPASNLAGANNFNRNAVNALNITTWTTKIDHLLGDRDRLSGRYILHDFPTYNTTVFEEVAADPNGSVSNRRAQSLVLNHIHTFTPALLSDFRFNWQPRRFENLSLGLDQGWPTKLGLKGVSDRAFPRIEAAGVTALGPGTQERVQIPIHDTHVVESVSWFRGAQSFKFGGEVRLARNVDDLNARISGRLNFAPQPTSLPGVANTGHAVASLLVGFPNSGDVLDTDILDRRAKYFALFAQDDWKLTSRLTLNVGLRWETHTPRFDQNDRQNGFDLFRINPVSGTPGVVTFAGRDGQGRNVYDGDYNNFAPRVGLAWKPAASTVLRLGYGVFFGPPLPGSNNTSAGFETSGSFTTPDNGLTAPFFLRDGFPSTARATLDAGFGAVRPGAPVRFAPEFLARDRRLGYSQQWNLVVQRDLGSGVLLELSYLGNVGHKLNGPSTSLNQVHPSLMGPGNAQIRRPFPQFGNVTSSTPMWGNSAYHGLNTKLEKRFARGLNFQANYTWAKFIDDVPASFEAGEVSLGVQNLYDRRAERALSGNDVRHRLVWSSVYEFPRGQGPSAMIWGGWSLGLIVTLQQGSPYGLTTQTNTTNAFTPGPQRVNVLRSPELPESERTVNRWFDSTALAPPPQFTFGNAGRALLTGPGLANFDVSLLKNHRWAERYNVQFRFEAFNFFNRVNFEEPGRALGAANFGVISVARPARILQLGLKMQW
jgi:outer membrane receptor protein involved in Fe transport